MDLWKALFEVARGAIRGENLDFVPRGEEMLEDDRGTNRVTHPLPNDPIENAHGVRLPRDTSRAEPDGRDVPTTRPRVYAELIDWSDLTRPEVWRPLRDRGIELAIAIEPTQVDRVPEVLERIDVPIVLWPLLDDTEGRWPSLANLDPFRRHLDRLRARVGPREPLLLDLEPPIAATRALLRLRARPLQRVRVLSHTYVPAWRRYVRELVSDGHAVEAVVPAPLLWGAPWDELLATPPTDLGFRAVEVMGYSSLLEGYGRGWIDRRIAKDLLFRLCREAGARGWRVGVGLSGGGALGDERAMRNHRELVEDVAIAHAAGARGLSLHSLEGALRSGAYEAWLDALCSDAPAPEAPKKSLRGGLLWQSGVSLGRVARRLL